MPSILKITDGTTTIDLLSNTLGFHLTNWTPQVAGLKGGGVYQSSDIAPGQQLVYGQFDDVNEVFTFHLNHTSQNNLIYDLQEFLRLLQKARAYWLTSWQDTPVYLIAQSSCETNIRYTLIKNYRFSSLTNPYAQPFFSASDFATMNDLTLGIERGHWLSNIPGQVDTDNQCANSTSSTSWLFTDWQESEAISGNASVRDLIHGNNNRILAAEVNRVRYTDDDGENWTTVNISGAGQVYALLKTSSGRILSGSSDDKIRKSDNNGASWTTVYTDPSNDIRSFVELSSGRILAGTDGSILYSDDNGENWASTYSTSQPVDTIMQTTSGKILAGEDSRIFVSTDNGDNWSIAFNGGGNRVNIIVQLTSGTILAGEQFDIFRSFDDGVTWDTVASDFTSVIQDIIQLSSGVILAGDASRIRYSNNGGVNWSTFTEVITATTRSLLESNTSDVIFAGDDDHIWYSKDSTISTGSTVASCTSYVVNKQNIANLTHIFVDDGTVFGSNLLPMSSFPVEFLPASPVVDDAIYFGASSTGLNTGPFSDLLFDIGTGVTFVTTYTITWEYYNGSSWATLNVTDNTAPEDGLAFIIEGVNSVVWEIPSDWATVSINSVTAYWVRARVSALTSSMTAPSQQNQNISALNLPYQDVASTIVAGDIPAITQLKITNESDLDGPAGSSPDLWDNRILVGLRSYDRGSNFQSYLNLSDEQQPNGIAVSAGTNTAFAADIQTPTGRRMTYNPGGVEAMATRATVTLDTTIARDYYGSFHAFLRARRTAGSQTDFDIQLLITSGSGGISFTTESRQLETTTAFELLDFGQVKLPVAGNLNLSELGDTTTIAIQASAASGTPDLYLYDLILIPVDEWSIDAVDKTNESDSDIGRSGDVQKYLDIDSLTRPKVPIRSLVRQNDSNLITSIYDSITPGEAILQANTRQRLWFLAAQTSATGSSYSWISPPEIVHSVQIYKNERYLGLRGNR